MEGQKNATTTQYTKFLPTKSKRHANPISSCSYFEKLTIICGLFKQCVKKLTSIACGHNR